MVGLLIGLFGVGLIGFAIVMIISLIYQRSIMATVCEIYLRLANPPKSDKWVERDLPKLHKVNDKKYKLPKIFKFKVEFEVVDFKGMKVFILNPHNEKEEAVIYLHGGGYVRQPRIHHLKFLNKLALLSGRTILVPIYPKAPNHTCEEVYQLLTEFYQLKVKEFDKIVMMGDSSGGGLALGLIQSLAKEKEVLPVKTILYSPWVDVELNNLNIAEYQKVDPFISASNERIWGKAWAGKLSTSDYRVSPINGDFVGVNDITLFVGSREVLYPDVKLLHNKLIEKGVKSTLIIGNCLNHVYPIYPIPEARKALKQTIDIINGDNYEND